ncbi:MAG: expansin EXLX1 family cellulose-binding protein [Nocardioides sp.]
MKPSDRLGVRPARNRLRGLVATLAVTAMTLTGAGVLTAPVAAQLVAPAVSSLVPAHTSFRDGVATYYGPDALGGACMFAELTPPSRTAALGPDEYAAAASCGMVLDVKGPRGETQVTVTNLCPECPPGHLDLTNEAFEQVGDPVQGKIPITYKVAVNPTLSSPVTVRVKEGSSDYWLALLIDQHGNPLTSVEARVGDGAWQALRRTDYNHWLADAGLGAGPFQVRIGDNQGHSVVVDGIALSPGVIQRTGTWMY